MNKQGIIKKISFSAIAVFFVLAANASAWGQVLVGYDFSGNNGVAATFAPTTTVPNVTASSISRGPGATASSANNSFRTTSFQNNGIATTNTDFFQFSVAATAGNALSLSSLSTAVAGTASFTVAPGVSQQFAYSLDGAAFTLIGSPQSVVGNGTNTVNLAGVAALQNVTSGTTVTFRYYASGQTTTGGYGFISSASGVNGLAINGTSVAPTAGEVSISGRVSAPQRFGSSSALVTLTDASGNSQTVHTGKLGGYRFSNVAAGETYVLTVSAKGHTFAPQIVTANEDLTDVDFAPQQ